MMISRDVSFFCQLSTQRCEIRITRTFLPSESSNLCCGLQTCERAPRRPPELFLVGIWRFICSSGRQTCRTNKQTAVGGVGTRGALCVENLFASRTTVYSFRGRISAFKIHAVGGIGVYFTGGSLILIFCLGHMGNFPPIECFCPRE
jgi:hypothetical protein